MPAFVLRSLAIAPLLCACAAPMAESDCAAGNWYARGEQEALMGIQPQIGIYSHQCSAFALKPDEAQYLSGWRAGYAEWNHRVSRGRP